MSILSNIFNRIKNVVSKRKILQLDSPSVEDYNTDYMPNTQFVRDSVLESRLDLNRMNIFENPNNYNEYCQDFFANSENFHSQYNYVDLISMMQDNGAMDEYKQYLAYVKNNPGLYYPSQVHGIEHTSRVLLYAEMLCMLDNVSAHEKNLIMVAAQLHDIGREDDGKNFDHGLASKQKIERLGLLNNFSGKDRSIIEFAISCHSLEPYQIEEALKQIPQKDRSEYKKVLDYLQDADKLDRTRIANKGWGLDPNRLSSQTAKRLVKVAHQNYFEYNDMMSYEQNFNLENRELMPYFDEIKNMGYNISFDDFNNIVSEYQPGTLEMLKSQNRLADIFSYDTFKKYRNPESFDDRLKPDRINPDEIFNEVNYKKQTPLLKQTFDADFMLYYNLKKNNLDAYNLLCYIDLDLTTASIAGLAEKIQISDLDRFYQKGYYFRMNDIFLLASKVTPEEYEAIIQSGNIEDLFSTKFEKDPNNIEILKSRLASKNIRFDDKFFAENYRFIEEISEHNIDIFSNPEVGKYSLQEIFSVIRKLEDTKYRDNANSNQLDYDTNTIIELLEYSKSTNIFATITENEQLDVVENFIRSSQIRRDPRYIEYINKKNRPYNTNNISEILNYKSYAADRILLDSSLDLNEAKSNFINAVFNIDVPAQYKSQFEKELMETIYYHRKYLPDSTLYSEDGDVMGRIEQILSSTTIKEFKDKLYNSKELINSYNTEQIEKYMKADLIDISRDDIASKLQQTAEFIEELPDVTVLATNGKKVPVKVLSKQEFYLATSTAMPKCSGRVTEIFKKFGSDGRKKIYDEMLNRQMDPNNVCTSITSDKMIAHAESSLLDQELVYAYVPQNKNSIAISAMYDLSSVRKNGGPRTTQKATTPRKIDDFVNGTTEEHNEAVMNNVYPRYIVCYDQITDIAVKKQEELKKEYQRKGINQPIEIVLVDSIGSYLPNIKNQIEEEHINIHTKLLDGKLTFTDFSEMFEKHESNIVLRTLQAIHSTSFRNDVWNEQYNKEMLDSLTGILDKVTQIVPPNKSRSVLNQVEILLERADRNNEGYGRRFYDHCYAQDIDVFKLEDIRTKLYDKVLPYERNESQKQSDRQGNSHGTHNQNDGR